jgi:hypothetical protein
VRGSGDEGEVLVDEPKKDGVENTLLRSFVGGQRTGLWNATWPLVRLDLYSDRIRLRPSTRLLRALVPPWEARFADITEVRAIGSIDYFTTGIRLRTHRPADFAVFWTFHRPEVLDAIEAAGLTVNREPTRFHYLNPDLD